MASGSVDDWILAIQTSVSDALTGMLLHRLPGEAASIISELQEIKDWIVEVYTSKLSMWKHLPYGLMGLRASNNTTAKEVAQKLREEWVGCEQKSKFHRVCHQFFEGPVLSEYNRFCDTDVVLKECPRLFALVTKYSLGSLVERAVEGEHAKINHVQKTGASIPATICARIREPYVLGLTENPEFEAWVSGKWNGRCFFFLKH